MNRISSMTKSQKTRQFIVETSAPLFNTKGISGTAMSDIMQATKMAKGGLYGHFESKDDLSLAVVDYNLDLQVKALQQAVAKAETPTEKLFAFLDVFSKPTRYPVVGGCPVLNFGTEADDINPVINEKVKRVILKAQRTAEAIIADGIASGHFRKAFNGREFSILLFSAIEGGILIGRVLRTNKQMDIIIEMLKRQIREQQR